MKKKIISIIALMFVLTTCKALDVNVRHFKYLHKVQTESQLALFNNYYVKKVEPQLRMSRTKPSHIETIDLFEIMEYYDVDTDKPFFLSYTAYGYVYTYFGRLTSNNLLQGFFYKEEIQ